MEIIALCLLCGVSWNDILIDGILGVGNTSLGYLSVFKEEKENHVVKCMHYCILFLSMPDQQNNELYTEVRHKRLLI